MTCTLESDVCVVGCGPAGITLARELVRAGASVLVVERGGLEQDPGAREFLAGRADGPVLKGYATYLVDSRGTGVGGAGSGWGRVGRPWLMPFAPIDFERRAWVERSGWPFGAAELEPFAVRAAEMLRIPVFEPPHRHGPLVSHAYHYPSDPGVLRDEFEQLTHEPRFRAVLGATALGVTMHDGRVESAVLRCADGTDGRAVASVFVLAAGGVENARLLLLAGVSSDALGRFFMEHFHVRAGTVRLPDRSVWREFLDGDATRLRVLALPDEVQRRERLLGATVQLRPAHGDAECELFVRAEQAPNPLSRVLLDNDPDPLGRRRARLDWLTLEQDWRSVVATASLVADSLGQESGTDVRLAVTEDEPWPWPPAHPAASPTPTWGNHHMGTTRMNSDPAHGVVDADCRVHGTENLFVAGSSVFPTGGFANPTFTIVALAIRLAERLGTIRRD